jgi:phosphatidylglycerophosphate synthase
VAGAVLLALGTYPLLVAGAAAQVFSYLLDRCDGELARYTGRLTLYGSYLESLNSNILYASVFLGLSIGAYRLFGDINIVWFGISALLFKYLYRFGDANKGRLLYNLKQRPRHSPMALEETRPVYKRVLWDVFMSLFFGGGIVLMALLFVLLGRPDILLMFYGAMMPLIFLLQICFHWLDLRDRQREN